MAWVVLVISGLFEAAWATALGKSDGLTKLWPSVVFVVTVIISMLGLGYAMRTLPTGTAYAIWVGIGASTTVMFAMATGAEPFHVVRLLLVLGIVACVVGLKLVS
ncbi:DMT family transporter [Tessaracoccus antarcticus]|uniref:QacE family quaternary ammonium compound efflux SMR transporter n=1 Tax=Tessaracoccus antarcticus TaxID=2479848 RepID=A0A3M0GLD8_9ACTN|nr:multidrug efflux SMR transporter [Tessaracoccus antarcticus]RMB62443.1 QacE family quaternary ammonium compound efflux SMR transporter [Tessaracoccus antarcticus]